ncbi:MAG TPA: SDR family oxidoreductase [Pyrinomonadaceae bacterium]
MKTVLITGATAGIGHETARQLVSHGYRVIVHGRTLTKATQAVEQLRSARAEPVWGDLSVMAEVLNLAEQVRTIAPTLDVLINNAGVYEHNRILTRDGFELTMAVNHLAPFLLTKELLTALKAAPQGRIITVSSSAHDKVPLKTEDFSFATDLEGYAAYATSKLANVLFTVGLADRLSSTSVTAYAVDPGVITTRLLDVGWGITGDPVEQGARTSVYLAKANDLTGVNGSYFVDCRPAPAAIAAEDPVLVNWLWQASEQLLRPFFKSELVQKEMKVAF